MIGNVVGLVSAAAAVWRHDGQSAFSDMPIMVVFPGVGLATLTQKGASIVAVDRVAVSAQVLLAAKVAIAVTLLTCEPS